MIQCVSKYVLYEIFNIKIRNPEEVGRDRHNTQNILINLGNFFSPFMLFSHYAVFPRKLKTHKPRTKCTLTWLHEIGKKY